MQDAACPDGTSVVKGASDGHASAEPSEPSLQPVTATRLLDDDSGGMPVGQWPRFLPLSEMMPRVWHHHVRRQGVAGVANQIRSDSAASEMHNRLSPFVAAAGHPNGGL